MVAYRFCGSKGSWRWKVYCCGSLIKNDSSVLRRVMRATLSYEMGRVVLSLQWNKGVN